MTMSWMKVKTELAEACQKACEELMEKNGWSADISRPTPLTILIAVRRPIGPIFFEVRVKESWS
jgi:hypothetical protein